MGIFTEIRVKEITMKVLRHGKGLLKGCEICFPRDTGPVLPAQAGPALQGIYTFLLNVLFTNDVHGNVSVPIF